MAWNKLIRKGIPLAFVLLTLLSCTISYRFNGASINYDKVKTITLNNFENRALYLYGPLAPLFNNKLQDAYAQQTKLQFVKRGGDLELSGEITGYDVYNKAVAADGYSAQVELRLTVNVRFVNNTNHSEDFEQRFTASQTYDSTLQLTAVQDGLIEEMTKEIVDQIFNATVANW